MTAWSGARHGAVLVVLAVLVSALSGCAGMGPQGKTLLHEYRISIPDQRFEKNYFADRNVGIDYELSRSGPALTVAGIVRFLGPIANNFVAIRYFNLQALFADANGVILGSHGITSSASPDPDDPLSFRKTLALPPGTAFMGFSYTGEAVEDADRLVGLGPTSFWHYPVL